MKEGASQRRALFWKSSGTVLWFRLFGAAFARHTGNIAVVGSHLEEGGLLGCVSLQFTQIEFTRIARRAQRFFGLPLNPTLRFVALFLLARMFFLAFGKA